MRTVPRYIPALCCFLACGLAPALGQEPNPKLKPSTGGKAVATYEVFGVRLDPSLTADGKQMFVNGSDPLDEDGATIEFLDPVTGKKLPDPDSKSGRVPWGPINFKNGPTRGLAVSLDGTRLAVLGRVGGRVHDIVNYKMLFRVMNGQNDTADKFWCAAFSPDGKTLAVGGEAGDEDHPVGSLRIFDIATGKVVHNLAGYSQRLRLVAFSGDGKRLVSVDNGVVKVWDAQTGKEVTTLKGRGYVSGVAISPDGKRVFTAGSNPVDKSAEWDASVLAWDATTGKPILAFKCENVGAIYSVALSRDGKRIAAGDADGTVFVWDETGKEIASLRGKTYDAWRREWGDAVRRERGSEPTGEELARLREEVGVRSVLFLPDDRLVSVAHNDFKGTFTVWKLGQ